MFNKAAVYDDNFHVDDHEWLCLNENSYHSHGYKMAVLINHESLQLLPRFEAGKLCDMESNGKVDSAALLGRRNQLTIQHRGENYTLRQTRAGKLILTK